MVPIVLYRPGCRVVDSIAAAEAVFVSFLIDARLGHDGLGKRCSLLGGPFQFGQASFFSPVLPQLQASFADPGRVAFSVGGVKQLVPPPRPVADAGVAPFTGEAPCLVDEVVLAILLHDGITFLKEPSFFVLQGDEHLLARIAIPPLAARAVRDQYFFDFKKIRRFLPK